MDAKAIGKRIREARLARSFPSQDALATRLGVTRQAVQTWESGDVVPPWKVIEQLASVLDVKEDWILFDKKNLEQAGRTRRFLEWVSEDELELLTVIRQANPDGQDAIIQQAKVITQKMPAPKAAIHPLRSKKP